jgi:transcriptional regulator with XRE-family HTH domain
MARGKLARSRRPDDAETKAPFADPDAASETEGVANRIREARRALGLTQDELARRVGVSRSAIAQWETDRTGQVRANLARVAAVLGVSSSYLLTGETEVGAISAESADERALLNLYRQMREPGRSELLRHARRMAALQGSPPNATD